MTNEKKKKFQEEENLGEPAEQKTEVPVKEKKVKAKKEKKPKAPKPEPIVLPKRELTEENFLIALKELGGKASVSHIRKQLGQPVFVSKEPKLVWAQDILRKEIAPKLVEQGKIKLETESRMHVYVLCA